MSTTSRRYAVRSTRRSPAAALVGVVSLLAVLGGTLAAPADVPGAIIASACAPATLTETPASGPTPLLANFSVQIASSTVPTYAWDFGDGTYYNGSGPLFASPVHRYSAPGVYNVSVVVRSSSGTSLCTTTVTATAAPFVAVAGASPVVGAAPLNVTFTAGIVGGTGTYTDALWWFDDGDNGSGLSVTYTFLAAGHYRVLLNVTDSAGHIAHASVWVNVSDGPPGGGAGSPPPAPSSLWVTGGLVGGVAVVLVLVLAYRLIRRAPRGGAPAMTPSPSGPPVAILGEISGAPAPVVALGGASPSPPTDTGSAVSSENGGHPPLVPETPPETLRLSQRVIVHLAEQGALPDDAVATEGFTQGGMAAALGVPQNRLSNVLRRLRDAGALRDDVRHVSGRSRRMKVYRLTPLGERLARDLQRRAKAAANRDARRSRPPR